MKIIDQIFAIPFSTLDSERFNLWLTDEILQLGDDFGQRVDDAQGKHIAHRMKEILTDKFRTWDAGTVHAIFQNGIAGSYGKATKVTVHVLTGWLYSARQQMIQENVTHPHNNEDNTEYKSREYYNRTAEKCLPFIRWCIDNDIDASRIESAQYDRLQTMFNEGDEFAMMGIVDKLPRMQEIEGNVGKYLKGSRI
jgi:hypothetical protein